MATTPQGARLAGAKAPSYVRAVNEVEARSSGYTARYMLTSARHSLLPHCRLPTFGLGVTIRINDPAWVFSDGAYNAAGSGFLVAPRVPTVTTRHQGHAPAVSRFVDALELQIGGLLYSHRIL